MVFAINDGWLEFPAQAFWAVQLPTPKNIDISSDMEGTLNGQDSSDHVQDEIVAPEQSPNEDSNGSLSRKRPRTEDEAPDNVRTSINNGPPWLNPSRTSAVEKSTALERSIFGPEPLDEFQRVIEDFILEVSRGHTNIEVEAKVGLLIDKSKGRRISLPVACETVLVAAFAAETRFESNMPQQTHARFNQILNKRTDELGKEHQGGKRARDSVIQYSHTYESDFSHSINGRRIRVTKNEKTDEIIEVMEKVKLGHLDIYSPRRQFDYRISVNSELRSDLPPPSSYPNSVRSKDRISYRHQIVKIDLTQVKTSPIVQGEIKPPDDIRHELEIEFLNSSKLIHDAMKRPANSTLPNPFGDSVKIFLNNIRMLIRNAR